MQTMSNADADANADADRIRTKSNMSPLPSVGGGVNNFVVRKHVSFVYFRANSLGYLNVITLTEVLTLLKGSAMCQQ